MRRSRPIICYSYRTPPHPLMALQIYRQLYRGLQSLRRINPTIKVYLIAWAIKGELEKVIKPFNVTLKRGEDAQVPLQFQHLPSSYPFLHKLFLFSLLKKEAKEDFDELMYVDNDTYFFSCPQKLFDETNVGIRGTPFLRATADPQRKKIIEVLCQRYDDHFGVKGVEKRLIRSSIILLSREIIERFFNELPYLYHIYTSLDRPDMAIFPRSDPTHLDEFALAIYFTYLQAHLDPFRPIDVWEKSDYLTLPQKEGKKIPLPVLSHYGKEHTQRFFHWMKEKMKEKKRRTIHEFL